MQIVDAQRALRLLTAAYPTYPVGDDTAELYLAALCDRVDDPDIALNAARQWVLTQDHFPKISELLEAVRVETRRRRPPDLALVTGNAPRLPPDQARQRFAELRRQAQGGQRQ